MRNTRSHNTGKLAVLLALLSLIANTTAFAFDQSESSLLTDPDLELNFDDEDAPGRPLQTSENSLYNVHQKRQSELFGNGRIKEERGPQATKEAKYDGEIIAALMSDHQKAEFRQRFKLRDNHDVEEEEVVPLTDAEKIELTIDIGYAWIAGFRTYLYWQNTTNCFNRITNFTFYELPWIRGNLSDEGLSTELKIDRTMFLIKNLTEHIWFCNSAWQQAQRYWYNVVDEYDGNVGRFFLSMLQNLLAKVISLTNLYFSIEDNVTSGNITGIHYDIARIVRVALIFDPIEPIDDGELDRINIETDEMLNDPDINPGSFMQDTAADREEFEENLDDIAVENFFLQKRSKWGIIGDVASGQRRRRRREQASLKERAQAEISELKARREMEEQLARQHTEFTSFLAVQEFKHQELKRNAAVSLLSMFTHDVDSGAYGAQRQSRLNARSSRHPVVGSHNIMDGTTKGLGSDWRNWQDILEVFLGFFNTTQITFGENRTLCQFAIEGIYQSGVDATAVLLREKPMNYWDFWLGLDMYLQIPYNLHDVYYSCYKGALEVWQLFLEYAEFANNLDILWFNMAFHAGQVVKNISNIVMYFVAKEFTRVSDGFTLGLELGQIVWMIFYPTATYMRHARDEGYEFQTDYTWGDLVGIDVPEDVDDLLFVNSDD